MTAAAKPLLQQIAAESQDKYEEECMKCTAVIKEEYMLHTNKLKTKLAGPTQEQQSVVAHKPRAHEQRDAEGADPTIEVQRQMAGAQQR